MFRKKIALFLVTAMVLTTAVPTAFAADTAVDNPPASTSEVAATSEGAITSGGGITSEGAITSQAAVTSNNPKNEGNAENTPLTTSLLAEPQQLPEVDKTTDSAMYKHLVKLSEEIGQRVASTENEAIAGEYIYNVFEDLDYDTGVQYFTYLTDDGTDASSSNIIAVKPGKSDKQIIVGAHYDSVDEPGSTGASDNASGISVMLGAAELLKDINTEYTVKFIAFGAEEAGLEGSKYYASNMGKDEIADTIAMINLDTVLFGDYMYVYGNLGEKGWLRDQALELAKDLELKIITQQGLNEEYPKGTTGDWSDHKPFKDLGLPWIYFESTNWDLKDPKDKTGTKYSDGDYETEQFGKIMHTERDNLTFMNNNFPGRVVDRLYTYTTLLSHLLVEIEPKEVTNNPEMTVDTNLVSMSMAKVVEVTVDFGYVPKMDNLQWTFGGKPFKEWKTIVCQEDKYDVTQTPFISFLKEESKIEGTTLKAKIKFNLPYGKTNLELRPYPRTIYPDLIGEYDLSVLDKGNNVEAKTKMKLNPYDSYHKQEEILPAVNDIIKNAKKDRYIEYAPLGKSAEGRDIPFVMFSRNESDINKYLTETLPMMLEHPAEFIQKIDNKTAEEYKPVIWFNNIHSDEANGVDAQLDILKKIATQDEITFNSASATIKVEDKDNDGKNFGNYETGEPNKITLDVQKLLDNYIIVFCLNNNPDGRFYNSRETVAGFDPNRDVTYQTQVEMANVFQGLAKWSPMICNDFHGFVSNFLIEPCTPPHEPNFEYDLLMKGEIDHAKALGEAGIANTTYDHYIIPMDDLGQGWDDGAPMYAAVLALMHGALGHTIEIPELNQESNNAFMYAGLGSLNFALEKKEELFKNQLEIYRRGVEGIDSPEVDKWLDKQAAGRPKGSNGNFFPEYYVLPVDNQLQKNPLAAYEMADYLIKNGIKVERTTTEVKVGEITYPSGSFIVPMHQAKRGLANCVLYDGSDFSDFTKMYAEVTMCFPMLRGFDKYEIREVGTFEGKTSDVKEITLPTTDIPSGADQLVIKNTNNDAIKAVNELLSSNKTVYMTYSAGDGFNKGDFIVAKKDLESIKTKYFLELTPFKGKATVKTMKPLKVAGIGSELTYVLKGLGFNLVDSYSNADVIADESSYTMPEDMRKTIENGTSYIAIGRDGMYAVQTSGLLPGFSMGKNGRAYEGVLKADLDTDSVITGRYNKNDILYNNSASWIEKVPATAKVLATISNKDDFYVAGWWPGHDVLKGKPYIIQDQVGHAKVTVFASHITNKAHPSHQFRLLANAIYDSLPGTLTEVTGISSNGGGSSKHGSGSSTASEKYTITVTAEKGGTISPSTANVEKGASQSFNIKADKGYIIEDVQVDGKSVGAVSSYKFSNVTSTHTIKATFKVGDGTSATTDAAVNVNFKDVNASNWFSPAVNYVMHKGIMKGLDNNTFGPNVRTNRAMIVTMLYRLEGQPSVGNSVFTDVDFSLWYGAPVTWANTNGVVTGYEGNKFMPNGDITREQLACILYRYAKYKNADITVKGNLSNFLDYAQVAPYAQEAVAWAVGTGLMTGKSGNLLDPKGSATRAEVAAMFQRIEALLN